jgi:hypothetical protein
VNQTLLNSFLKNPSASPRAAFYVQEKSDSTLVTKIAIVTLPIDRFCSNFQSLASGRGWTGNTISTTFGIPVDKH